MHAFVVAGVCRHRHAPGVHRARLPFVQSGHGPAHELVFVEEGHDDDHVRVVDASEGGFVDEEDISVLYPYRGIVQIGLQDVLDGDLTHHQVQIEAHVAGAQVALGRVDAQSHVARLQHLRRAHAYEDLPCLRADEVELARVDLEIGCFDQFHARELPLGRRSRLPHGGRV